MPYPDGDRGAPARALAIERTIVLLRWAAVAFAVVQILTYYRPHPDGAMASALVVAALLAVANGGMHLALRRVTTARGARLLSLVALVVDTAAVMGFVLVYSFDADTAMWAVVYILPLEGAIRFQLAGALTTMAAATVLYTVRELYGEAVYGNAFYATSVSFRMGIGFIIAVVAGWGARMLVREREELQRAKDELERSAAELERGASLKDDFLAMTNHELRTPLTTILGYTATLRQRWDELGDAQRRELTERIEAQGQHLLALVEDMLTLSAGQAGGLRIDLRAVPIAEVLHAAIEDNGRTVGEVELRCPERLLALADPVRLQQVVSNYIANALKHGRRPIEVEALASGDEVRVCVADHGTGVPPSFVPHLFDRFTRGRNGDTPGAGLGLAIVKQLVEAQGGRAWYEPNTPTGARFCLSLPAPRSQVAR